MARQDVGSQAALLGLLRGGHHGADLVVLGGGRSTLPDNLHCAGLSPSISRAARGRLGGLGSAARAGTALQAVVELPSIREEEATARWSSGRRGSLEGGTGGDCRCCGADETAWEPCRFPAPFRCRAA
jgi:hypothetical protein